MNALSMTQVSRRFGVKRVLKEVDLTLPQGTVLGLLGKNGAGKTTLLKLALGLLKANGGDIQIFGEDAWDMLDAIKERVGFVPQKSEAFHWMKVQELLDYTGAFFDKWSKSKAEHLLSRWELDPKARVANLSEGQKQRLAIIQATAHSPDLLILDEPVASLDPAMRRDFIREIIDMNLDSGTSVLFSTHITSDIERVAADVAILKNGAMAFQGGLDQLKESTVRLHIHTKQPLPADLGLDSCLSQQVGAQDARVVLQDFTPGVAEHIAQRFDAQVQVEHLGLEDIFLEMHS